MTPKLSKEQRQAVEESHGAPVEVVDPATKDQYMLMRADFYNRLVATLDLGEPTKEEKIANLQAMGRSAGWEDPESDVFDDLEPR